MKTIWQWAVSLLICIVAASSATAQITVDLSLVRLEARVFYVGDVDPAGLGNAPDFFRLTLNNAGSENVDIQLRFVLLAGNAEVVSAETDPFTLPPGMVVFTNSQLNVGSAIIPSTGENVELRNYNVDFDRVQDLQDKVISTGRLPSGSWTFWIGWREYDPANPGMDWIPDPNLSDNVLLITNPTTLEPIFPGNRVGGGEVMEVPNAYPYFIWQSDAAGGDMGAVRFNLYVYEKYPDDMSIQDVLSHPPVLNLQGYSNLVFQYPTDTSPIVFPDGGGSVGPIRPLNPGSIYYWFVEALVPTVGEDIVLKSDVYAFKVATPGQQSGMATILQNNLQQILGDQFDYWMQQLQGYQPSGNVFLNGTPIPMSDFLQIFNQINQGMLELKNIDIE